MIEYDDRAFAFSGEQLEGQSAGGGQPRAARSPGALRDRLRQTRARMHHEPAEQTPVPATQAHSPQVELDWDPEGPETEIDLDEYVRTMRIPRDRLAVDSPKRKEKLQIARLGQARPEESLAPSERVARRVAIEESAAPMLSFRDEPEPTRRTRHGSHESARSAQPHSALEEPPREREESAEYERPAARSGDLPPPPLPSVLTRGDETGRSAHEPEQAFGPLEGWREPTQRTLHDLADDSARSIGYPPSELAPLRLPTASSLDLDLSPEEMASIQEAADAYERNTVCADADAPLRASEPQVTGTNTDTEEDPWDPGRELSWMTMPASEPPQDLATASADHVAWLEDGDAVTQDAGSSQLQDDEPSARALQAWIETAPIASGTGSVAAPVAQRPRKAVPPPPPPPLHHQTARALKAVSAADEQLQARRAATWQAVPGAHAARPLQGAKTQTWGTLAEAHAPEAPAWSGDADALARTVEAPPRPKRADESTRSARLQQALLARPDDAAQSGGLPRSKLAAEYDAMWDDVQPGRSSGRVQPLQPPAAALALARVLLALQQRPWVIPTATCTALAVLGAGAAVALREPARFELMLDVAPPDAQVSVDGRVLPSPGGKLQEKLPLGRHELAVKKAGFSAEQRTIDGDTRGAVQQLQLSLSPEKHMAALSVSSIPSGAAIRVDGRDTGRTTPSALPELTLGAHAITLQLEGYESAEQAVRLPEDALVSISLVPSAPKVAPPVVRERPPSAAASVPLTEALLARRALVRAARATCRQNARDGVPFDAEAESTLRSIGESCLAATTPAQAK